MQKLTAVGAQAPMLLYFPTRRPHVGFIMKVSCCCMLLLLLSVQLLWATAGNAQGMDEKTITLELNHVSLKEALNKVSSLSGFQMAYPSEQVKRYGNISLARETRTVRKTLELLLQGTDLGFKQVKNSILLFQKATSATQFTPFDLAAPVPVIAAQDIVVNGTVTGEAGEPLTGASITVKGSTKGTSTAADGSFELSGVPENATLLVTAIGHAPKEVAVNGKSFLSITLLNKDGNLSEVVVIGYGTTTQRNNTGAVSTVDSKTIEQQPVADPLGALQGRIPGLFITSSNGLPGSSFNVRVRGQSSVFAGNDPLYIVDGVPYISESLNQFSGANGTQSPLASINPADIERIDVLKDADATAIYGSRGSNGVILITTKKGKAGKAAVTFNVYTGGARATNMLDMLNTQQYLALRNQAFANDGMVPDVDNAPDLKVWDTTQYHDWQDMIIGNTAHLTEAQASLTGGTEQTRFLLSGTYRHETTVFPGNQGYGRGAGHLNIDHHSENGKLKVSASVNYTADKNNSIPTDITQYYNLAPDYPIYDSAGNLFWYGNMQNPLAFLSRKYVSRTDNFISNVVAGYELLPGLDVKASAGYTAINMEQVQTYPEKSFNPDSYTASLAYYGNNRVRSYIIEPQLTYTKTLGKGKLNMLAGGTWQQSITEGSYLYGSDYPSDELLENPMAAVTLTVRNSNYTQYNYQSVFGRANYSWQDKYFVNATFRRDGSSRFGPGKRSGNFGAIGAAWVFSDEPFVRNNLPFLSFGKLRGSYGITGNDQIGDYGYLDSWESTSFPYGSTSGLFPSRIANPEYSWEENRKLEGGLELGFLDNRIRLTTDYYYNRSGSQLFQFRLAPQTGFNGFTANLPALVQNNGWEFDLNTINIRQQDFTWSTSLNLTIARNKLVKYPDLESSSYSNTYVIGQSLGIVKGYHFEQVDPATGLPVFLDVDKSGSLSEAEDYVIIGNTMPDFYGGLQNSLQYKHWRLDFMFQFVKQEGPGLHYGYLSNPQGIIYNTDVSALDRWQKDGDVTSIPRATQSSTNEAYADYRNYYRLSDATWEDASYIRLKNLSLSYDLSALVRRWQVRTCTVFVRGQNLLTITSYKGFDPETQGYALPPLKMYTAGVNFSL